MNKHDKNLDKLAALLRKKPITAREIAEKLGCCKPTAYQRLRALIERGDGVITIPDKTVRTGPPALLYAIR